VLSTSKFLVCP